MTTEERIAARDKALQDCRSQYYEFEPGHFEGRYFNSNGYGCAVVATIGQADDWKAYIGGCDPYSEDVGLQFVASHGSPLSEADARYFFPDIDLVYRR